MTVRFNLKTTFIYYLVGVGCVWHTHTKVRGQLAGAGSPTTLGPRDGSQVSRPGGKYLYLLTHLSNSINS